MSLRFFGCGVALGGGARVPRFLRGRKRFALNCAPNPMSFRPTGLSTTSIFVQLPQNLSGSAIIPSSVRFATTSGSIESQAILSGGVARVLLRSATTPGTAVVTAFIGNARETTSVEFSEDTGLRERFLEVAAPYVAYGNGTNLITTSGATTFDFGDLHIESDVRLDVDLANERLWAQGNAGGVRIRNGHGAKAVELRGRPLVLRPASSSGRDAPLRGRHLERPRRIAPRVRRHEVRPASAAFRPLKKPRKRPLPRRRLRRSSCRPKRRRQA